MRRTPAVALLLFASGFCALAYQVAWLREFRLIFGASTAASAAVLAIFIGGLGAGSLWLGPRADRHSRPLRLYATLETIVAISAAASPLLLAAVRAIYLASGGSMRLGMAISTIVRLVLSVPVLAAPTIAMGGTLPAASRAVTTASDVRRHDVAVLYGVNTLGAVAGCLVSTFALLELFGTRQTIWLAALVNLLVAMTARHIADRGLWNADLIVDSQSPIPNPQSAIRNPQFPAFVLVASASVGFAFFLMELVWYRLLAPLLGGSVFTFGLVLAAALVGIGVGGLLYALTDRERPATLTGFATTCLLEAAAVAATFALGDRVALLTLVLVPMRSIGFGAQIGAWSLVAAIVVVPPAIIAGYQFPMLIALLGRGRERVGRQVGLAYAANTIGAIAGSLAGGFGVLPLLSAPGTWRVVAIVLALLGVVASLLAPKRPAGAMGLHGVLAVAVGALLFAPGPTAVWRHGGIGAGRAPVEVLATPNQLRSWEQSARSWVEWEGDGVESSVALVYGPAGYAFLVNGKSDGSARGDAGTQVMLGLLGAIAHPRPRRALVVGLGTGATSGWLAAVRTIERVDTIELEPLVLRVARECAATNLAAMRNPKLHVVIGDAREALLTGRDRYDVIASEPSNPFRAGIASLFTAEFYRAARDRLSDDGVFAQWVQGYEIDAPTLRTIYATLGSVFPQIDTWQTQRGDIVLLAFRHPQAYSGRALAARLAEEPFHSAAAVAWRAVDVNAFLAHYVGNDGLARSVTRTTRVDVNTDDRNAVEFGLARSVGRPGLLIIRDVRQLARILGANRPPLADADGVSWPHVDTARVAYNAMDSVYDEIPLDAPPGEIARRHALVRYYQSDDYASARAIWAQQSEPPRDLIELAMVAHVEAEAGSDDALGYIGALRRFVPSEADTILAILRLRQARPADAAAALESALVGLRGSPWPVLPLIQRAVDLADPIAARDPGSARRLYEAIRQRFSVAALDSARLVAAAGLTRHVDFAGLCREPIGQLEPHVPWTESFLTLRRDCYQTTGDARLPIATRELAEFYAGEPVPLGPR